MPASLDEGVALEPRGNGSYGGKIGDEWWIDRGPNGGFLASILLNALQMEVDAGRSVGEQARHPRSLNVHYLARPEQGPITIQTSIERKGRSFTAAMARMFQGDRQLAIAQCAFSTPRKSGEWTDDPAPNVPAPDEMQELVAPEGMLPRFAENFEYRFAIGALPYSGAPKAEIGGWVRPRLPRAVDALLVTTLSDGFPPAAFARSTEPFAIPTIDLTVHFRADLPREGAEAGEWCLARFRSVHAERGFIEEDGVIWGGDGSLLAHSRQLAMYIKD